MIIYSEKTKKEYNTVDECIEAEKVYDAEINAKIEKQKALEAEKENRKKEIVAVSKEIADLNEKYKKLISAYVKDFGEPIHNNNVIPFPDIRSMLSLFPPFFYED